MEQRSDITQADVFISWTGRDQGLKDHITRLLKDAGLTCKESDESCSGDYRQWSREAVGVCSVFLLIWTENATTSQYIPMELEALEELVKQEEPDDQKEPKNIGNYIVPVCTSQTLYEKHPRNLHEFASAVFLDTLTREQQDRAILQKVTDLLTNRMEKIYRRASTPDYLQLRFLCSNLHARDREYNFRSLYIPRTVTEVDEQGLDIATLDSPDVLLSQEDILFLHGPGGSGKTAYINQIRECAKAGTLVFSLPCATLSDTPETLFEALYREFDRICGSRAYYSRESFRRLLSIRRTVLIMDGMDEISTRDGTRACLNKIADFYKPNMERITLIFTSRNESDAELIAMGGKAVRQFRLDKLREEDIRQLGENLFLLFGSPEKSGDFYTSAKHLSTEIRTNPLLLSQLALVYQISGKLPDTLVGIWDAISEITFRMDADRELTRIRNEYKDMVQEQLPEILKAFARTRYQLQSQGKNKDAEKILSHVLKPAYGAESKQRAKFLLEYLENRAILIRGEFYHKMLLEYFTAVYYYEHSFDDFDEIQDETVITELFSHYADPYWAQVLKLYLMKADTLVDEGVSNELYALLTEDGGIREYTLLLDTARELSCHRESVQQNLVTDILTKSTDGTCPPYGPLFWYVPEYGLYEAAVLAAEALKCPKALALTRDVCVIFGQYQTLSQITDKVDGFALYDAVKPALSGVRRALCQLFCTGTTNLTTGTDIYPRCFNTAEADSFLAIGCGVFGRMSTPFADELGLYRHESWTELDGEYIGIVSCPYDKAVIEEKLNAKPCAKLRGLILTPTEHTTLEYIAFSRSGVELFCPPENITRLSDDCKLFLPRYLDFDFWEDGGFYHPDYRKAHHARLPEGIPAIGEMMFFGCTELEAVFIPSSVTVIGAQAFCGCENLRFVALPEGITTIMDRAFMSCKGLEGIDIPDTVTEIQEAAFANCRSLSAVRIPTGITDLAESLFNGCSSLAQVSLPNSLTEIGDSTFANCSALMKLRLPDDLRSIGKAAFKSSGLHSIRLPEGITRLSDELLSLSRNLTEVNIPNTVTEIGRQAFWGCRALETISIPDSAEKLGTAVLGDCDKLRWVRVPTAITRVPDQMFLGCKALREVLLPDTVQSIEHWAFRQCVNLNRVRYYASDLMQTWQYPGSIGGEAFLGCTSLTEFRIPDGVATIGMRAFKACTGLQQVQLPESVTVIDKSAFEYCIALTDISLPDGIQELAPRAFRECCSLQTVHIPTGLLEIQAETFSGCTGLTDLWIPDNIQSMDPGAFAGCTALERISLPSWLADACPELPPKTTIEIRPGQRSTHLEIPVGTVEIPENAYLDHRHLESVSIPDSVQVIGSWAFEGCTGLREIWIPDSVTHIGCCAFLGCTGLQQVRLPARLEVLQFGVFRNCTALEQVVIPEGIRSIPSDCFGECSGLKQITLPQSLTEIESNAFCNCESLTQIRIPNGVTRLESGVFADCEKLTRIVLSDNLTEIDISAFASCSSLEEISIPSTVRAIGSHAFQECTRLTFITLPDGLTAIEEATFDQCSSLTKLHIPASVSRIGDSAFHKCTGLQEITLPAGLTVLGIGQCPVEWEEYSGVFAHCESLRRITIPDGVTQILRHTFFQCTALEEVHISEAAEIIGDSAFRGCGLTAVRIPGSVRRISESAFADCDRLKQVTFSPGLEEIEEFAFEGCESLEELVLPMSLRRIGRQAFGACQNLRAVTISANFKCEIDNIFGEIDPTIIRFI